MTRTKSAERPRTRFVWDELLSHKVPRALRVLGFNTTYVGAVDDGAPPRQATDAEVIEFATRTNQVIVTSNHDMMLLCHEAGQPFVWIDPRGRQLQLEEQVLLCFRQVRDWDDILASGNCVHAMRTKAVLISSAEAARLATTASSISARHINESEDGAAKRDRLNVLLPGLPPSTLASMGEVRVRRAGATTVTARGLEETDIIHKKKLDLESILCQYDQDYLVIEGDPGASCPNIVTGEKTEDLDERMDERTIAFSGIIGDSLQCYKGLPVMSNKKDIKKMVDLIEKEVKIMADARKETEVKMYFDDNEVPMVPFVEAIIRGSIMGIAKELKGYEEGCEVKIVMK